MPKKREEFTPGTQSKTLYFKVSRGIVHRGVVKKDGTRRELPMDGGDYDESDEEFDYGFNDAVVEDGDEDVPHIDFLLEELEDSDEDVRTTALRSLSKHEPETLAQHAHSVLARLEDFTWQVRKAALQALGKLKPATLAQHADAVIARLDDPCANVRHKALQTLGKLKPATLDQHADAIIARLDDGDEQVRYKALKTLGKLDPATLAQHAHSVLARLEDSTWQVRTAALQTLGKLEPATLAQYANAVINLLEDTEQLEIGGTRITISALATRTLRGLPRFVTHGVDFHAPDLRSRLLGRLGWYKCRRILCVRSPTLYWYALPYRPSGPGHARDVEAWNLMNKVELACMRDD